jgi:hypothetical protein
MWKTAKELIVLDESEDELLEIPSLNLSFHNDNNNESNNNESDTITSSSSLNKENNELEEATKSIQVVCINNNY